MTDPKLPDFWVNRGRSNRKRHLDNKCRFLVKAREMYDEEYGDALSGGYADERMTPKERFVRVRPKTANELAAVEAFTTPCIECVPGARELWKLCPVDFE
jgi:hypothetical protein